MIQYVKNKNRHEVDTSRYSVSATENVRRLHRMIPDYSVTPLWRMDDLAGHLGVKAVYLKDESARFGLKAFKGLGGAYAMFRIICRELGLDAERATLDELRAPSCRRRIEAMTFITTTDGNHGKGVSWAAKLFGCISYVYMPKGTVEVRAEAVRKAGNAVTTITEMKYDDCVAWTAKEAERNGWFLIQDTAWDGYEEVPEWIMQGYTTMIFESAGQMPEKPTHLFLQAGVGSMVAAAAAAAVETWGPVKIYTVEPTEVACFYDSFAAGDGKPHPATGSGITEMAGLNCAVPCKTAWTILSGLAEGAFACSDDVTETGMKYLAGHQPMITAGESGAVTAGLMIEMDREMVSSDSVILLINTEGDTDPEHWKNVIREAVQNKPMG